MGEGWPSGKVGVDGRQGEPAGREAARGKELDQRKSRDGDWKRHCLRCDRKRPKGG